MIDPAKPYIYLEDNGDGTCTYTMNIPELNLHETMVMETSLQDYMANLLQSASTGGTIAENLETAMDIMTVVPDTPEDL